jgi:hypothetical protein
MIELIFVHVPKAGGTSVNQAIRAKYQTMLFADNDSPADPTSKMNLDPDGLLEEWHGQLPGLAARSRAITGHLWIRKYDRAKARLRATVLKHPIDRLISHYFFWLSDVHLPEHPLRSYAIKHRLGIVQFARLPIMRRFYVDHLFRGVDMKSFDFICDSQFLESNWKQVMRGLGLDVSDPINANKTTSHVADYPARRDEVTSDISLMRILESLLADDMRFYENALMRQ